MDFTALSTLALGWVGQHLKAIKSFPTPAAQAIVFGCALALYSVKVHPEFSSADWFTNAVAWALAALGVSSVVASSGLAPKTDSR